MPIATTIFFILVFNIVFTKRGYQASDFSIEFQSNPIKFAPIPISPSLESWKPARFSLCTSQCQLKNSTELSENIPNVKNISEVRNVHTTRIGASLCYQYLNLCYQSLN